MANEVRLIGASAAVDGSAPYVVGDRVFVVCEAIVDKITHQSEKGSESVRRIASAKSIIGAVVDADLVREAIELARMNREALEGIQRLGFEDGGA